MTALNCIQLSKNYPSLAKIAFIYLILNLTSDPTAPLFVRSIISAVIEVDNKKAKVAIG